MVVEVVVFGLFLSLLSMRNNTIIISFRSWAIQRRYAHLSPWSLPRQCSRRVLPGWTSSAGCLPAEISLPCGKGWLGERPRHVRDRRGPASRHHQHSRPRTHWDQVSLNEVNVSVHTNLGAVSLFIIFFTITQSQIRSVEGILDWSHGHRTGRTISMGQRGGKIHFLFFATDWREPYLLCYNINLSPISLSAWRVGIALNLVRVTRTTSIAGPSTIGAKTASGATGTA